MDEKRFEAFESPAYPALAVISEHVELRTEYLRKREGEDKTTNGGTATVGLQSALLRKPPEPRKDWELKPDFSRDVLVIQLSPGMGTHYFDAALEAVNPDTGKPCEGIIVRTLGSGNIPTARWTTPRLSVAPSSAASRC